MTKLTIPAILAATIMVAGIFAFMPVEQASTVHTTIVADLGRTSSVILDAATIADPGNSATSTVTVVQAATAGNVINGIYCIEATTTDIDTLAVQVITSTGTVEILDAALDDIAVCNAFAGQELQFALLEVGDNTGGGVATVDGVVQFTESENSSTDTDLDT